MTLQEGVAKDPKPRYTKEELDEKLYDADPNCSHELDPNNFSGIKCLHCKGWFCY